MSTHKGFHGATQRPLRQLATSLLALVLGLTGVTFQALAAERTDIVRLVNGDRITGDIKELAYGQLKLRTDYIGTIYIQWNKIAAIQTQKVLQLELADGRRHYGRIEDPGPGDSVLRVTQAEAESTPVEIRTSDVVRAWPLKQRVWYDRLEGSFSIGYSYTQSSSVEQFNFAADVGSRARERKWRVSSEAQVTNQAAGQNTQRATVNGTIERLRQKGRFVQYTGELTHNQGLGLDLRTLVGVGYGRYLYQREDFEWKAVAGVTLQNEIRIDGGSLQSSEASFSTEARLYRLDHPKRDISASITVLPSLTESGRVRGEASLRARQEFIEDMFLELSLYESYDSDPPQGADTNDWGVVTSLGFTF